MRNLLIALVVLVLLGLIGVRENVAQVRFSKINGSIEEGIEVSIWLVEKKSPGRKNSVIVEYEIRNEGNHSMYLVVEASPVVSVTGNFILIEAPRPWPISEPDHDLQLASLHSGQTLTGRFEIGRFISDLEGEVCVARAFSFVRNIKGLEEARDKNVDPMKFNYLLDQRIETARLGDLCFR